MCRNCRAKFIIFNNVKPEIAKFEAIEESLQQQVKKLEEMQEKCIQEEEAVDMARAKHINQRKNWEEDQTTCKSKINRLWDEIQLITQKNNKDILDLEWLKLEQRELNDTYDIWQENTTKLEEELKTMETELANAW